MLGRRFTSLDEARSLEHQDQQDGTMTEEVRALLFAATQNNRLSRALAAEVGPVVEILAHAYRIGFNRGRGEVLESLYDVPRDMPNEQPELLFEDLGHLDRGEMQPGDVAALIGLLARAYALGFSRGAREAAAHALGVDSEQVRAVVIGASERVEAFADELRCELCERSA